MKESRMEAHDLGRLARVIAAFRVGGAIPLPGGEDEVRSVRASVVPHGPSLYGLVERVDAREGAFVRRGPLVETGWTLSDLAAIVDALPQDVIDALPEAGDDPAAAVIARLGRGPATVAGVEVGPGLETTPRDGVRVVGALLSDL